MIGKCVNSLFFGIIVCCVIGGRRDSDGYMWVTGRVDDVMCVSGHRIGTAEVEAALGSHPSVAEAAAIQVQYLSWKKKRKQVAVTF